MNCIDVCYKTFEKTPIHFNVYPPTSLDSHATSPRLPAVVYFHGGGLTVGNRTSWFPSWLKSRIVAAGLVFISADYRLLPGATLSDIIEDIQDLFSFLSKEDVLFKTDQGRCFGVDAHSIAVAGSSAGGTCAYLAAIHAFPRPKAVLGMYAMFGDAFTTQTLIPKTEVFFRGRELLDPINFSEFMYPNCTHLEPISESELAYHPPDSPTPGWPANPRMPLTRLYLQLGVMLDYSTGQHEPSLSAMLRPLLESGSDSHALQAAIQERMPSEYHRLFPQFNVTSEFPPTFLCHGSVDTAVLCEESRHMAALLERAGVPVKLIIIDGAEHSLDYVPDAEELYGSRFDEMAGFLRQMLEA